MLEYGVFQIDFYLKKKDPFSSTYGWVQSGP